MRHRADRNLRTKRRARRERGEPGVTLPELLISVVLTGTLLYAVTAAFTVVFQTAPQAEARVSISKDISFVQTWLPVDLASASQTYVDPLFSPATSQVLPGTNALTIRRFDITGTVATEFYVAYRYLQVGGEWQLARFEIRNPGTAQETVFRVGVAHELAEPPLDWTPDQAPTHAVEVRSRNQVVLKPIGEDVTVTFSNGEQFATGGAGLSEDEYLPTDPNLGFVDPSAPPSRCGGTITLVLDTSSSIPDGGGGVQLENAAVGFIDQFRGTPVRLNVIGFDKGAYRMAPTVEGAYLSLLNDSPEVTAARNRIRALDDRDFNWDNNPRDWPTVDGIYWGQVGDGTNWESALHMPFFTDAGVAHSSTPDLVVFITDGLPNRTGTTVANSNGANNSTATTAARNKANEGRRTSARIIGVLVGDMSTNTGAINAISSVVGTIEYNATLNGGAGNASVADYYRAQFADTATALRAIMAAECGGTVTLQKKIDVGGVLQDPPANSTWNYSTDIGDRALDRSTTASVTLDYSFNSGQASKTVRIVEDVVPGYVFDRIECRKQGSPVSGRVTAPIVDTDGNTLPGADILLQADEALSCFVISRPA
jgi:hypothetical protein